MAGDRETCYSDQCTRAPCAPTRIPGVVPLQVQNEAIKTQSPAAAPVPEGGVMAETMGFLLSGFPPALVFEVSPLPELCRWRTETSSQRRKCELGSWKTRRLWLHLQGAMADERADFPNVFRAWRASSWVSLVPGREAAIMSTAQGFMRCYWGRTASSAPCVPTARGALTCSGR